MYTPFKILKVNHIWYHFLKKILDPLKTHAFLMHNSRTLKSSGRVNYIMFHFSQIIANTLHSWCKIYTPFKILRVNHIMFHFSQHIADTCISDAEYILWFFRMTRLKRTCVHFKSSRWKRFECFTCLIKTFDPLQWTHLMQNILCELVLGGGG